jgi:ADP-heptose:LPS heptosyltransferase
MGDLVQMGTLLSRLHEEWPDVEIDLVVDRRFAGVASLLTGLRDVITYDFHELIDLSRAAVRDVATLYRDAKAWARPLQERRYDRIVNLTFTPASSFLAGYIGAADYRGGRCAWDGGMVLDNPWMAYFTDMHRFRHLNRFNLVDVYALGGSGPGTFAPLNVRVPGPAAAWATSYLSESDNPSKQWIAVQAGASDVMKAWRPEHFGAALARLSDRWQGGILLIGTSSEQEVIARVVEVYRAAGGRNRIRNAAGRTTLEQLVALLDQCRLLLTNDTGPMHLAVGVGTPVIDLSVGHVDFRETGPYGPGHWVIQPELECAPCGFQQVCAHHACKDRISPDGVAALMLHALGEAPSPIADPGFRLYQSGVDEDQLGTYLLKSGEESPSTQWYAAFWRRYWYESMTGRPSLAPAVDGPPPEEDSTRRHLTGLIPMLDRLCRRAAEIARVARQNPTPAGRLRALQGKQTQEREQAVSEGMASPSTAPVTSAFLRTIHNDNVEGLDRLAQFHSAAYEQWRTGVLTVRNHLERCGASRPPSTLRMIDNSRVTAGL